MPPQRLLLSPPTSRPALVALVDTGGGCEEPLELVRSALGAALLAAGRGAAFGLLSFDGDSLTLWDASSLGDGRVAPVARVVPLTGSSRAGAAATRLAHALPLFSFLAPVDACGDAIEAAVEALRPSPHHTHGPARRARAFGPAVDALLTYFGAPREDAAGGAPSEGDDSDSSDERSSPDAFGDHRGGGREPLDEALDDCSDDESDSPPPLPPSLRILCFLTGPPDAGIGRVSPRRDVRARRAAADAAAEAAARGGALLEADAHACDAAAVDVLASPATGFYSRAAARARSIGAVFDVFLLPPPPTLPHAHSGGAVFFDVATLCPLSRDTGGSLLLYECGWGEAPLPRDVHRAVSQPSAMHVTARLRCSPELRAARCYGRGVVEGGGDGGDDAGCVSMGCVGPTDALAFDFDFSTSDGLAAPASVDQPPCVQLAFEYTAIVSRAVGGDGQPLPPSSDAVAPPSAPSAPSTPVAPPATALFRERRRRVATCPCAASRSAKSCVDSADAGVVGVLLLHKALRAAASSGLAEARLAIADWLAVLAARAARAAAAPQHHHPPSPASSESSRPRADACFARCPPLAPLTRVVWGMLRGDLLSPASPPDARAHAAALAQGLPPHELALFLYPQLVAWSSPADAAPQGGPPLPLSRAAIAAAGAAVYVLDAFTHVVVYAPPTMGGGGVGGPHAPLPPPRGTPLRDALDALRAARLRSPRLVCVRGGVDDATPLEHALLDDGGGAAAEDGSLGAFVAAVDASAAEVLKG